MRKVLSLLLVVALASTALFAGGQQGQSAGGQEPAEMAVKNPDTFVYGTIGTIHTLDPCYAYDNASGVNINQMYERLVNWDRGTGNIVAELAEEVPTMENGGISADGLVYRFKIKKGVKFHDGSEMTPEDVEYSIERQMAIDMSHGPQWMYFMVFFGTYGGANEDGSPSHSYDEIDKVVEVEGDTVVMTLAKPFDPFLGILTGYWGSIVNKDFAIANGGWDGTGADMLRTYNPAEGSETLYEIANGTGPYKFDRWIKGDELVVTRFEDYHGKKPAMAKGIYKILDEWSTRKLMLLQGDVDFAYVDPGFYADMENEPGLMIKKDLARLALSGIQFNLNTNVVDNPLAGSGMLDGNGVPADFFADINVRYAFLHAWDEDTFLQDIVGGHGKDPVAPFPTGLPFKNENMERPAYDLDKAAEYLKKAHGGKVWENGFTMELAYNSGNETRGGGLRILAENINSINPKFQVSVRSVQWAEYLELNNQKRMPLFFIGWAPDYPDMDNYADPFMHSEGYYSRKGSYSNPVVDELIVKARYSTDPAEREELYFKLQDLYVEDAVGIANLQTVMRHHYRDWIKFDGGYFFDPVNDDAYNLLRYIQK